MKATENYYTATAKESNTKKEEPAVLNLLWQGKGWGTQTEKELTDKTVLKVLDPSLDTVHDRGSQGSLERSLIRRG